MDSHKCCKFIISKLNFQWDSQSSLQSFENIQIPISTERPDEAAPAGLEFTWTSYLMLHEPT